MKLAIIYRNQLKMDKANIYLDKACKNSNGNANVSLICFNNAGIEISKDEFQSVLKRKINSSCAIKKKLEN